MTDWAAQLLQAYERGEEFVELDMLVVHHFDGAAVDKCLARSLFRVPSFFEESPPCLGAVETACRELECPVVVDYGAGAGRLVERLVASGIQVMAVEVDEILLHRLRDRGLDAVPTLAELPGDSIDLMVVAGGGIPIQDRAVGIDAILVDLLRPVRTHGRILIDLFWPPSVPLAAQYFTIGPLGVEGCCLSIRPDLLLESCRRNDCMGTIVAEIATEIVGARRCIISVRKTGG